MFGFLHVHFNSSEFISGYVRCNLILLHILFEEPIVGTLLTRRLVLTSPSSSDLPGPRFSPGMLGCLSSVPTLVPLAFPPASTLPRKEGSCCCGSCANLAFKVPALFHREWQWCHESLLFCGACIYFQVFSFFPPWWILLWWIIFHVKNLHIFGLCLLDGFPEIELLSQRAWIFLMLLIRCIYLFKILKWIKILVSSVSSIIQLQSTGLCRIWVGNGCPVHVQQGD